MFPLKLRLINHTPRIVTAFGYLLGLGILCAAGTTWFIKSDILVQASTVLHPAIETSTYGQEVAVLSNNFTPGMKIISGDVLATIYIQPQAVAQYKLRQQLDERLAELREAYRGELNPQINQLETILHEMQQPEKPEPIIASCHGWLLKTENSPNIAGKTVAPGKPVIRIGHLESVTAETNIKGDRVPMINPGDSISLLMAEWSFSTIETKVLSIITTVSIGIPRTLLSERESDTLEKNRHVDLRIQNMIIPAEATINAESLHCVIKLDHLPASFMEQVQTDKPIQFQIINLSEKTFSSKWSLIDSNIALHINGGSIGAQLHQSLLKMMLAGDDSLSVSRCWIQTGQQRLFWRLFRK